MDHLVSEGELCRWTDIVLATFFFLFSFFFRYFLTDTNYAPKLLVSVSTRIVLCRRLHENSWQAGKAGSSR